MFSLDINNSTALDKVLSSAKKINNIATSKDFINYLKEKVIEELYEIQNTVEAYEDGSEVELTYDQLELYKNSHDIKDISNGFVVSNSTTVPADTKTPERYPGGVFPVALAIEYGVGLIGAEHPVSGMQHEWAYNVNNYDDHWTLPDNRISRGYQGFQVYQLLKEEVADKINNWFSDYLREKGGI